MKKPRFGRGISVITGQGPRSSILADADCESEAPIRNRARMPDDQGQNMRVAAQNQDIRRNPPGRGDAVFR
jgi:hypothetical protein